MAESDTTADLPDVSKTVIVAVPVDQAFRAYVEFPIEWVPPAHRFTTDTQSMTIEGKVGGRFYERDAQGNEVTRGTIVEWTPPTRLVMTWRVGAGWQPIGDDEHASHVEIDFAARSADATEMTVTYTHLKCCEPSFAAQLAAVLAAPGPGETLERYLEVAARHAPSH